MIPELTMIAYLGPETMLPMTSVVAGVAGFLMMFGRKAVRWTVAAFRTVTSRRKARPESSMRPRRIGVRPGAGIKRDEASKPKARS